MAWLNLYRIAEPGHTLVFQGLGKPRVRTQGWAWLLRRVTPIPDEPYLFKSEVHGVSKDLFPLKLEMEYAVGPDTDNVDAAVKFLKILAPRDTTQDRLHGIVDGIVNMETRSAIAKRTFDESWMDPMPLQDAVLPAVQQKIGTFGLKIHRLTLGNVLESELPDPAGPAARKKQWKRHEEEFEAELEALKKLADANRYAAEQKLQEAESKIKAAEAETAAVQAEAAAAQLQVNSIISLYKKFAEEFEGDETKIDHCLRVSGEIYQSRLSNARPTDSAAMEGGTVARITPVKKPRELLFSSLLSGRGNSRASPSS